VADYERTIAAELGLAEVLLIGGDMYRGNPPRPRQMMALALAFGALSLFTFGDEDWQKLGSHLGGLICLALGVAVLSMGGDGVTAANFGDWAAQLGAGTAPLFPTNTKAAQAQTDAALASFGETGPGSASSSTALGPVDGAAGESAAAANAVRIALGEVGKPYIWGGVGPGGFDCSGLIFAAYGAAGVAIPRTSEAQWAGLPHVPLSALVPGDLVFYAGSDGTASEPGHVVLYIGGGQCVQAEMTGTPVQVTALPAGAVGAARVGGGVTVA
jgi:cell wall-associated NlpC family hydrolase